MFVALSVIGIVVGVIAISSAVGKLFGKYVDLRREQFGETTNEISGSMDQLMDEIQFLRERNEELTSKIESMEALVTSPEWDLLKDVGATDGGNVEKTLGRNPEKTR